MKRNLDFGRPLTSSDIIDDMVMRIADVSDEGCYCYLCQKHERLSSLTPLTRGTGVMTNHVRCEMDSPVYVCLEHAGDDAFQPDMLEQLRLQI